MRSLSITNDRKNSGEENKVCDRKYRTTNDHIPLLRAVDQLHTLRIDLDSPRFKEACENLGVLPDECRVRYVAVLSSVLERSRKCATPRLASRRTEIATITTSSDCQ